jgi:hypothetical protein
MSKRIPTESFSAEQALGDDPFSPKRLHLLRALADAVFAEPPADAAAQQENDELVATFAALFCPGLPEEQARSHLAVMVTALLEEAAEEEKRREREELRQAGAREAPLQAASALAHASMNGVTQDLHLTPSDERLIRRCMADFGYSREEAIRRLILHGGI